MRRLLLAAAILLLSAVELRAACTNTPNMGLANCTVGTPNSVADPAWINNFLLLDFAFTSPVVITGAGSPSPTVSLGTVGEAKGGTNQTTYAKGDTLYASAANTLSKLGGNVTTTRKFREQHGNGTAVTTEAWDTIQGPDITSGTINPARIVTTVTNSRCIRTNGSGALVVADTDCSIWGPIVSGSNLDAGTADYTIPNKFGTTPPGTCGLAQTFFDTDAPAGSNIYGCTSANTWTLEGGGGGSGDNVSVNGTAATNADFDDTTPAAVGTGKNVLWQKDAGTPNNISAYMPLMVASGGSHAVGLVPDPGASAGSTKFLREDATWAVPAGAGGGYTTIKDETTTLTARSTLAFLGSGVSCGDNAGQTECTITSGGGGITGSLTSGRIPVASGASTVVDTANFTFDTTNFRLLAQNLTVATDGSIRMLEAKGTLPASPSANVHAFRFEATSAGSAAFAQQAGFFTLGAGYTGSGATYALSSSNAAAGTANTLNLNSGSGPAGNIAYQATSNATTSGLNVGVYGGTGNSSSANISVYGSSGNIQAGTNIGVLGNAANSSNSSLRNVAGYFTLHSALVTGTNLSAAIIGDGAGNDILRGYNAATLKTRIGVNGEIFVGNFTVSGLPTCGASDKGLRATITDANAACTFAGTPTGGGSTVCPAYCDGSAWKEG
jgi:hypothetical protein